MAKPEPAVEVLDVSAIDGVRRTSAVFFDDREDPLWFKEDRPEIPEVVMDKIQKLLGDGNAAVTVGMDAKTSVDYGNSAGCMVYVKLTCNQDEKSIEMARLLASGLAAVYVDEGQAEAAKILNRARGFTDDEGKEKTKSGSSRTTKVVRKAPSKAKTTGASGKKVVVKRKPAGKKSKKVTQKNASGQTKPSVTVKSGGKKKPVFKRK